MYNPVRLENGNQEQSNFYRLKLANGVNPTKGPRLPTFHSLFSFTFFFFFFLIGAFHIREIFFFYLIETNVKCRKRWVK